MEAYLIWSIVCIVFLNSFDVNAIEIGKDLKLKVVTVATDETDGYHRFIRSAKVYGLDVETHGLHEEWLGGDMANGPGGGHKINILRKALLKYKDEKNTILMFTDSYDVVFTSGRDEILKKFLETGANVLISSEDFIWPDKSLEAKYPTVEEGYRFLCSGGIIGYAPIINEILNVKRVDHTDDDQLYYTQIYLEQREKYNIKLDHKASLFQNLHGNEDDVQLKFAGPQVRILNNKFNTQPVVIHGNGPSKDYLNHLANYISNGWNFQDGCTSCKEDTYLLNDKKIEDWPTILIGLYIPQPTPFVESFLHHISNLDYPKEKIHIFLSSIEPHHNPEVDSWINLFEHQYKSFTYKGPHAFLNDKEARNMGIGHCSKVKCDYYFSVDADVTLSNRDTLKVLLQQNRTFLVPMMSKAGKLWSNFWGALSSNGFYARSPDYIDIVKYIRRGVWNSPFVANLYLIKANRIEEMVVNPFYSETLDQDMAFTINTRKRGIFMYVTNLHHFGHLKEVDTYTVNYKHNDMYQIFDNRLDWEDRYLHPQFTHFLDKKSESQMPCPDVYWFPFVTANFSRELIEECEFNGDWSGGKHEDKRISGGYENVPTDDIHMKQLGFEKHWIQMLKDYVAPMATRYYDGYHSHSYAIMNFVVKYTTTRQYFLRPHHDASTFTINMALNTKGVDYEGGGARFLRYNCSIADTRVGWAMMHPGRLTHQHEGLPTTNGTRYIMVSFIDP